MTRRALAVLALALSPDVAAGCAVCLDSAYGSRTFNWAFAGLMLTPFVLAGGLLGGVAWVCHRARARHEPGSCEGDDVPRHPAADPERLTAVTSRAHADTGHRGAACTR